MAGFRQGGLSLKKRDNGSASDINFVSFYVDSFDRLYSVDTFGTSALVSNQWSTGCIDEDIPELIKTTDNITVPELRIAIFSTPNYRGPLFRKTVSQASFTIPRDGHSKYVVVDYDSGTPYFRIETDIHNVNQSNVVCLYTVWNLNGSIHSILFDNKGEGLANKIDCAIQRTTPYRRSIEGGLILSVDASRYIHVSDSHVYAGTTEVQISSFTSLTDRITEFYHTSSSWAFPETMSGYQIDNLHFDNGTDLTVANNNKYLCRWVYRTIGDDKEVFIRIGIGEYNSIGDAQKELEPVSPSIVKEHGMLIGRVIIQKGSSTTLVNSIFEFAGGGGSEGVSNHNDLTNIQGGDSINSEYYHLDYERFGYLSAVSADVQTQINDLHMLTSGTGITQIYADSHYLKLDGTNGPITSNLGVAGTLSASSVSAVSLTATSIQGTTITIGNVSNTEFQRLDGISANIQNQFTTLSATKADKSTTISTGTGLTGGGDLSTNRTISLETTGTAGTYTKVTTDQYGRVTAGTLLLASDIPSGIDASKISTGTVSNTEFNFLDGTSANLQNQLSNLSATKANIVIVSGTSGLQGGGDLTQNRYIGLPNVGTPGTYTKVTTDQYGRISNGTLLTSADIPTLPATKIGTGIINDTEFNYLDGISANIQTQLTNLSGTKADKTTTISTGTGLTGGGDLSTNRTISLATTGTAGTYIKVTTDAYGRVLTGNGLNSSDIPSGIDASKISTGVVSNTEFNYLDGTSANIQNQLSILSATKANNITISGTSGLIGGGDLTQNRFIGMPNIGTPGTYTKLSTDAQGRVSAATNITSADVPTLPISKIQETSDDRFVSDSQINSWTSTTSTVQSNSANWNSVYSSVNASSASWNAASVSAHNHGNKSTLDLINQGLNTAADVVFSSISATSTLLGPTVNINSTGNTSWLKVAEFKGTDTGTSYKFETILYGGDWFDHGIAKYAYNSFGTISTTSAFNIRRTEALWRHSNNEIYSKIEWKMFRENGTADFEIYVRGNNVDFFTLNAETRRGGKDGLVLIQPVVSASTPTSATHTEITVTVDEQPVRMLQDSLFVRDISKSREYSFQYTSTDDVMEAKFGNNSFFPATDNKYSLGSGSNRWANLKSVSAEISSLSATTITVGSIDNTEFSYLNGTSANIQTQLTTLSASRLFVVNGSDNRIATFNNSNTLNGESGLTFDGTTLGIGLSANITNPILRIRQNPGAPGGGEIRLDAAGVANDENSGKLYLPGHRIIGLTNTTYKHQRYNYNTSAYETVFGIEAPHASPANKDVTFYGDLLTLSATNPRFVVDGPVGNAKGVRFNDSGTIRWYAGTLSNNSFAIQDVTTNDYPISALSGSTGTVTLGATGRKINIPNLSTSAVVVTDGSKNLVSSPVTTTQLGYLSTTSANIQTQINNILNGTSGKYSTTINILASVGQTFTITHNLGYLKPVLKLVDETNHQEILVSPNYISTTQLSFVINSRAARTGTVLVQV